MEILRNTAERLVYVLLLVILQLFTVSAELVYQVFVGCSWQTEIGLHHGIFTATVYPNDLYLEKVIFSRLTITEMRPFDITYSNVTKKIYFLDGNKAITQMNIDGSNYAIVRRLPFEPTEQSFMGIDVSGDRLVWTTSGVPDETDANTGGITLRTFRINGFEETTVYRYRASGIAIDQRRRRIFWTKHSESMVYVYASNFDSMHDARRDAYVLSFAGSSKIAFDHKDNRLYFTTSNAIVDFEILNKTKTRIPYNSNGFVKGIDVLNGYVLFTDYGGLRALSKTDATSADMTTAESIGTGLENCSELTGLHVATIDSHDLHPTPSDVTTATSPTVEDIESSYIDDEWSSTVQTTDYPYLWTEPPSTSVNIHTDNSARDVPVTAETVYPEEWTEPPITKDIPATEAGVSPKECISWTEFEMQAECFEKQMLSESADQDEILASWERINSAFPEFQNNDTQWTSRHIDTQVFSDDILTLEAWSIKVTSSPTNDLDDNESYDFKITYPAHAWNLTSGNHGYSLVTSVLRRHNLSIHKADDTVSKHQFGSPIFSITVFDSTGRIVPYIAKKAFDMKFKLLPSVTGMPSCWFLTSDRVWSQDGCTVTSIDGNSHVTCSCDHMTSFAVLMQVVDIDISESHQKTLSYISYITLSISILCLVATIVLFLLCRLYKSTRIILHINLAASLLLAQLIFVTGINAKVKSSCIAVAVLLHYLYLVVFAWMLVEGVYLFLKVNPSIKWNIKLPICIPLAWGLPAVIALVTLGAGNAEYGHNGRCWLPFERGLVYGFVVPVIIVTIVNLMFLFVIIYKFLGLKANKDKSQLQRTKAGIRAMAILVPLLGVTWIFGVLQFNQTSAVVFSYLFVICNGLQGVFIFVAQCLLDDEVKVFMKQTFSQGRVNDMQSTNTT